MKLDKLVLNIHPLEDAIGYQFKDKKMLLTALTHTSYINENRHSNFEDNERLEFLGDAILDVIVSEYLYKVFPELPEGDLTKLRAAVVCEPVLARISGTLHIGQYLLLGKGEALTGGRNRTSLLENTFEALTGAIYLDGGLEKAADFVMQFMKKEIHNVRQGKYFRDFKTALQEEVQKKGTGNCRKKDPVNIHYDIIGAEGPDHDKVFIVSVTVNNEIWGKGRGKSKKEAEQQAARVALEGIKK